MAALLAINLAISPQLTQVEIEGDCINIINALQSPTLCLSSAGVFIHLILSAISFFDTINFGFAHTLGNSLAHLLARNGGSVLPQLRCNFDI